MKTRIARISTKTRIALMLLWLLAGPVWGANWYVTPSGGGNGTAWNNAWTLGGITWASVSGGDTIYLAGGTNYTEQLHIQKSGSAGNYITIKRATTSDHGTAAGWQAGFDNQVVVATSDGTAPCRWNSGAIGSYVIIDGQQDNGIKFQAPLYTWGIYPAAVYFSREVDGVNHVELKNLEIAGAIPDDYGAYPTTVYLTALTFGGGPSGGGGDKAYYISDILVTNCNLHGAINLVLLIGVDRIIFDHCQFHDNFGSIYGGLFPHPNVMEWAFSKDVTMRYCEWWDWEVEGIMMGASTSSGWDGTLYMYGNVFHDPWKAPNYANSARVAEARFWSQTIYSYNNTFINLNADGFFPGGRSYAYGQAPGATWSDSSLARNNIYWSTVGEGPPPMGYEFANSLSTQISGTGSILNGSNPFQDLGGGDYRIITNISTTLPCDKGVAIANFGVHTFDIDFDGNTRGQGAGWDMGAFEAGGTNSPPATPTNAVIQVVSGPLTLPVVPPSFVGETNFLVSNPGNAAVTVSNYLSADCGFVLGITNYVLESGGSTNVTLTYTHTVPAQQTNVTVIFEDVAEGTNVTGSASAHTYDLAPEGTVIKATNAVLFPHSGSGWLASGDGEALINFDQDWSNPPFTTNDGGVAHYWFTNGTVQDVKLRVKFYAPLPEQNSVWWWIDDPPTAASPSNNYCAWDMPTNNAGNQTNFAAWRGNGTVDSNEFNPLIISNLDVGFHTISFLTREAGTMLFWLEVVPVTYGAGCVPPSWGPNGGPFSLSVEEGRRFDMSANVYTNADIPLWYGWFQDGTNFYSELRTVFPYTSWRIYNYADPTNAGAWHVVVSNGCDGGSMITSAVATVTVQTAPEEYELPVIAFLSPNYTNKVGAAHGFSVYLEEGATTPLAYQWRFNGANIASATGDYYVIGSPVTNDSGSYSVVITNIAGAVTSANSVYIVGEVPYLIDDLTPTNQSVIVSSNWTFSVTAGGYAPLSYLWYLDGVYYSLPYANYATISNAAAYFHEGTWQCVVTNMLGSVTSRTATLDVIYPPLTNYSVPPLLRILSQ